MQGDRVTDEVYLRPLGFLWGETASKAVRDGLALPIGGGPAACFKVELIEGRAGKARRRFFDAAEIGKSGERAIAAVLRRITAPRPPIAGLSWTSPRIMGIVNVTPDSFSDGGDFGTAQSAIAQARLLAGEGADIIDIGGESTRPGAAAVDETEEMRRVLPVVSGLRDLSKPISVDTRKARIMDMAAQAGAALLNDISALSHDPRGLATAARLGRPVILMHAQGDPRTMQDDPRYEDVLLEVYDYLEARLQAAEAAGVARDQVIADPGIGFGKTAAHNLALLQGISLFHGLGVPLLVGASRKGFVGALTGEKDPKRRGAGSIGIALAAAAQAVQLFRVHDVTETKHALAGWEAARCG
jgi:dihydropteroate synthase